MTKGYSGADISTLCAESMMAPLREIKNINDFKKSDLRDVVLSDFINATKQVKSSVSRKNLMEYFKWNS